MAYENLLRLAQVMDTLRSPGGCPWDSQQSHESLLKYLLEETYELIEAVESGKREDIREELGDLLLQVYFHSRIAEEDTEQPFNIDDVAKGIVEKLISRHPHVFSEKKEISSADLLENWEEIKRREKSRSSAHDGVPIGQPALSLASKLIYRAEKNKLATPAHPEHIIDIDESKLGDELLSLISWAVANKLDPEVALRKAALKYRSDMSQEESG